MAKLIRSCSIWRALEVIGDSSTIMIIEAAWLGSRSFGQFRHATNLRRGLLSDRLKHLVTLDVMHKVLYSKSPSRFEYRLTTKGQDLYWMSLMMLRWERNWGANLSVVKVRLTHSVCGKEFDPVPKCATCGDDYCAHEVSSTEGPGVGMMSANHARRRQRRDAVTERPAGSAIMVESAQILGDRWAALVLRAMFSGFNTFEAICDDCGIATNILSERLNWMQSLELVRPRQKTGQRSLGYGLTKKSVDLYPILLMVMRWGDTYYAAPEGPPLLLFHGKDEHPLDPVVACSGCRVQIALQDVTYELEWPDPTTNIEIDTNTSKAG